MNRIALATVWLLTVTPVPTGALEVSTAKKQDWLAIASMLGETITRVVQNVPEAKTARRIASADRTDEYALHVYGQGLNLNFRKDRLTEIYFQLLPGKKIVDAPYSGTLPFGIVDERITSDEIVGRVGQPLEQEGRAWKLLNYRHDAYLISLYFAQNRLEAVRVVRKEP